MNCTCHYHRNAICSEIESYLGYEPNSREEKETTNRLGGYFDKTIKTSMGETTIEVPCDRHASFESIILHKHKRGSFFNDNSIFKLLYLKVVECKKNGHLAPLPTGRSCAISCS